MTAPPRRLLGDLRRLIQATRQRTAQFVNAELVRLYWNIGARIHTDLLKGGRAGYGEELVALLSRELTAEYGQGFGRRNLFYMIRLAEVFPDPKIVHALSAQLSWTHLRQIIGLEDPLQRDFYAQMCRLERWSTRTDVEAAILRELEHFILELGAGFSFVARQKRITVDNEDYYLDLLFFHRILRRLVAVELKMGKFQAADKGQMELYLCWLDRYERQPGEEAPLGLILCAERSAEHVELLRLEKSGIRVAEYLTELPPRRLLESKLHEAIHRAQHQLAARPETDPGCLPVS